MAGAKAFAFDDAGSFDDNLKAFAAEITATDAVLGPALMTSLAANGLVKPDDKGKLLDALLAALRSAPVPSQTSGPQGGAPQAAAAKAAAASQSAKPPHWFLSEVQIEGIRGINNEGSPLVLKFKPEAVNSVTAPNGVGKSSIFDALAFALTGNIRKLDELQASERGGDYYLNRFHPADTGKIKITLLPDNGGKPVTIEVTRHGDGKRSVVGPAGIDADALLAELNREFVLLDGSTFRSFIDDKALDRGRAFAGLLGLARYSSLRQDLQALCNTRAFNSHFDVSARTTRRTAAETRARALTSAIAKDYDALVKEPLDDSKTAEELQAECQTALSTIPVLTAYCTGKKFAELNCDECINIVKGAEGGPQRQRLSDVIREQDRWSKANPPDPANDRLPKLAELAKAREDAMATTAGALLLDLYRASKAVMSSADWPSPSLCPTCGNDDDQSVLAKIDGKLADYAAVDAAAAAIGKEWREAGWGSLIALETLALQNGEAPLIKKHGQAAESGTLTSADAAGLAAWVATLRDRAQKQIAALATEKDALEKVLPPSLVTVTTAVETARRLKASWTELDQAQKAIATETRCISETGRLKTFLDASSELYAKAESQMAAERLRKVQPVCRDLFKDIMFSPVVPALEKRDGSEEMSIRLAEFWSLQDVSAQALLSESFRNAFAVSVYLAAASLYGGAPRFIVLDDVTSSFDAGHQHHLVEVIRTKFARPLSPNGPQLILLSHDTLLEKLFNKHSGSIEWWHQRLEGSARTAVLQQSGSVNKVRDTTLDLLNAGRVDDAAPRIRQYLEYILHEVIDRCRIPVPMDVAFGDNKRTPGEYLSAIQAAVDLHQKAGSLVLDATQVQNLTMHSTAIISNYLSHWSTGQSQTFSAPALIGVMRSIDAFPDCFRYTPTPGQQPRYYRSLSSR